MNAEVLHLIIDQFLITNFIDSSHMLRTVRSQPNAEAINQPALFSYGVSVFCIILAINSRLKFKINKTSNVCII